MAATAAPIIRSFTTGEIITDDTWPPPCSACGRALKPRKNRATGQWFFGCSNFPRCRFSSPLTPHPDDRVKPAQRYGFGWSLEARKAHDKTLAREAWESGLVATIKRLENGDL